MNDTTKKSFVLYTSYLEQVKLLSNDQAGVLFKAILQYAQDKTVVEMDDMTSMAFAFIKSQMDTDSKKYEESKKKRVEAGRSGGLAKASKAKQSQAELSDTTQSLANQAVNVDVNVNDNVNESEDVNVDVNDVLKENENNKKENVLTNIREKEKTAQEEAFDKFWALYPKKKSKGDARKAWKKLKPDQETIEAIMTKLPQLIASKDWQKEDGQYIPFPASWLNAEGWNDEVTQTKTIYQEVDSWV